MLTLDSKKIRKGKAVGLPYVGSKKKISKKIVELINQNFSGYNTVYDLFGGGGAITAELLINGYDVVYNDLDKSITDMFYKVLTGDHEWLKSLIISRAEFKRILTQDTKTTDEELKLLVNSFGNDRKTYLYNATYSDIKYRLSCGIINANGLGVNYKQTPEYKLAMSTCPNLERLQQLERLYQLSRLNAVDCAENLTISNLDYAKYNNIEDSIIYLDPPYQNSDVSKYRTGGLDYTAFYDWVVSLASNNVVIISSYEISDPRFEVVYEFTTARSTLSGQGPKGKHEQLYMVKGGKGNA